MTKIYLHNIVVIAVGCPMWKRMAKTYNQKCCKRWIWFGFESGIDTVSGTFGTKDVFAIYGFEWKMIACDGEYRLSNHFQYERTFKGQQNFRTSGLQKSSLSDPLGLVRFTMSRVPGQTEDGVSAHQQNGRFSQLWTCGQNAVFLSQCGVAMILKRFARLIGTVVLVLWIDNEVWSQVFEHKWNIGMAAHLNCISHVGIPSINTDSDAISESENARWWWIQIFSCWDTLTGLKECSVDKQIIDYVNHEFIAFGMRWFISALKRTGLFRHECIEFITTMRSAYMWLTRLARSVVSWIERVSDSGYARISCTNCRVSYASELAMHWQDSTVSDIFERMHTHSPMKRSRTWMYR